MVSLTDARFDFALDSLKKAALIETKDNLFFSPHSIHHALSLAYFGARGTTEASLKQALRIPDQLSKVDVQHYYSFERSLNQVRSEVSDSGISLSDCVIARRAIYFAGGMSRRIARDLSLHQHLRIPKVLNIWQESLDDFRNAAKYLILNRTDEIE